MRLLTLLALAIIAVNMSSAQPPESRTPNTAPNKEFKLTAEEQAVLDLVNAERKKENLDPLKANEQLTKAAREHSINMAKQLKLAHELDDKRPADRVKETGYRDNGVGENVAYGAATPAAVMKMWMDSEGHKANILGKYTEFGVGSAIGTDGLKYWTQVFSTPAGR